MNNTDTVREFLLRFIPESEYFDSFPELFEIRLYLNKPIVFMGSFGWCFLSKKKGVTKDRENAFCVTQELMSRMFSYLCNYSLYSVENELKNGYITIKGGHRAGIGSKAVIKNNMISSIKDISSLCIRIANEKKGCGYPIMDKADWRNGILIAGAPCSGKTTVLRDIARILGDMMIPVSVIDERGELSGGSNASLDLGLCSDVLSGYSKKDGILKAVRALSPKAIICDEVGGSEDALAVTEGACSGAAMIASIHAGDPYELTKKLQGKMLLETGAFANIVFLSSEKKGTPEKFYRLEELDFDKRSGSNSSGSCLYRY